MKKLRSIDFICSSTRKIPSVNATYKSRVVNMHGKHIAQVYVVKETRDWKRDISSQLDLINFEQDAPWIFDKNRRFSLKLLFLIGSALNNSDVDNRIKAVQDCLFKRLGLNDSRVLHVDAEKRLLKGASHEKICFHLEENLDDPVFNNLSRLPRPREIFLGGTCAGEDWRPDVIKWLGENHRKYDYYNPVVPDWTPDCIEKENIYKKEKMDCFLAIITPSIKGVYSIAEIIDEIYQVRESGFGSVIIGILGTKEEYGEAMWKSIQATKDMINNISSGSKQIVAANINKPTDICQFLDQSGWKGKRK